MPGVEWIIAGALVLAAAGAGIFFLTRKKVASPPQQVVPSSGVGTILTRANYDYAPCIVQGDDGVFHMYWCGCPTGGNGDKVFHSVASNPRGPWRTPYDYALEPTGNAADHDGKHTCDPNVIKVGGTYYLYYGSNYADPGSTAIGVAQSVDGVHFTRMNGGKALFTAADPNPPPHRQYGAGQPAVFYRDGWFHMSMSDSTAPGASPVHGAGQFMMRARDPEFREDLQEFTQAGWANRQSGHHTGEFSYLESFGLDLAIDGDTVVAAINMSEGATTIVRIDATTFATIERTDVPMPNWKDGPGLLSNVTHKTLIKPLTIVSGTGPSMDTATWDLSINQLPT